MFVEYTKTFPGNDCNYKRGARHFENSRVRVVLCRKSKVLKNLKSNSNALYYHDSMAFVVQ